MIRTLRVATLATLVVLTVAGCGNGKAESIPSFRRPLGEAEGLAARMPLGTSIQVALGELGHPNSRFAEGRNEVLHYGSWSLEFEGGRLARKSTERFLKGGVRPGNHFDEVVRGLTLGEKIGMVRRRLGRPERVIETLENGDEKVTELGYGGWQIVFVNGRLEERTHT